MILENVKELCAKKDISISALEKKAGIGNGTISGWNEYNPKLDTLMKVADALDVSVTRLLRKKDA